MVKVQAGLLLNQNRGNSASWQRTRVASGKWHVAGDECRLDLRGLLKGLRVAYLMRASRKREREEAGGNTEYRVLRHFNWILLNFDSDPHSSCNCNKL